MPIKVMSPEQLFDSLIEAMGPLTPANPQRPRQQQQQQRPNPITPRVAFITFFGIEDGADPTEYQGGIPQVLRLMNGPIFNNARALGRFVKPGIAPEEVLDNLFLSTLSRRPTENERQRFLSHIEQQPGPKRPAYADILWVLLNSSEFTLNH
jgi:hypothetical protein